MQEETEWTDAQYDEPAGEKEAAPPTTSSFFSTPVTPIRLPKRGRDSAWPFLLESFDGRGGSN
jgi:hypothetical protein